MAVRAGYLEVLDQLQRRQQEIQGQRLENEQLRAQLTALATELASLRERIGRSSRNSSKPPSSDGPGYRCAEGFAYKPPERRNGQLAASAVGSRAIPALGRGCCRWSGWMR